jgi:integrase
VNGHAEKRTSSRTGRVTWQARLYVDAANGGPRRETVGHYRTRTEALDALDARKDEIRGGAEADAKLTVGDLLERYLSAAELGGKTRERYRGIVDDVLVPEFGDLLASRLRPSAVQEWQSAQLEKGRVDGQGYAPATVRQHRAVLSGAYEWALAMGIVRANPVRRVKAPRGRTAKQAAPTLAVAVAAVEACRGRAVYLCALLCLTCDLRRGEALALTWDAVDLETGTAVVRASLSQTKADGVFVKTTKAGRVRRIPIPASTVAELRGHRTRQDAGKAVAGPGYADSGYVCAKGDGTPRRPDTVSHSFCEIAQRRGLDVSLHDLRRAYATYFATRQLLDPESLRDLLGHVDVRTTFDYYVEPVAELQRAAVGAYDEALADARSASSGPRMDTERRFSVIQGGKAAGKAPAK